jgi:hypothetical protein
MKPAAKCNTAHPGHAEHRTGADARLKERVVKIAVSHGLI